MVRNIAVAVMIAVCLGSVSRAQISPEQAMKRLKEKQAARQADRDQLVSIKKGDLDDLKSEIARLKAQLDKLEGELASAHASTAAAAQPAVKTPLALSVGLTKAEMQQFVQVHRDIYEITSDTPRPTMPNREDARIVMKAKRRVFDGTFSSNGVSNFANYREQVRPDQELLLLIIDGKIASIVQNKLQFQSDEVAPIVPNFHRHR